MYVLKFKDLREFDDVSNKDVHSISNPIIILILHLRHCCSTIKNYFLTVRKIIRFDFDGELKIGDVRYDNMT